MSVLQALEWSHSIPTDYSATLMLQLSNCRGTVCGTVSHTTNRLIVSAGISCTGDSNNDTYTGGLGNKREWQELGNPLTYRNTLEIDMQSHLLFDCSRDDRSLHCPCQFHTPLSTLEPCDQAVITALFLFPFSLERSPVLRILPGNPTTLSSGASHCSSLALGHNTPAGEGGIHLSREHATPESHTALAPYPLTYFGSLQPEAD
jgi:hypothetical protein